MTLSDRSILLNKTVDRVNYDGLLYELTTPVHEVQACDHPCTTIFDVQISRLQLAMIISVVTAAVNACLLTVGPIYIMDAVQVGSDPYMMPLLFNLSSLCAFTMVIVIRWCHTRQLPVLRPKSRYLTAAIIGFFGSVFSILLSYGSLPTRTRSELLGILSAAVLPNTVICRYIAIRKGVSFKRLLCAAMVLLGLFVSLIPEIFTLASIDENGIQNVNHDHHKPADLRTGTSTVNATFVQIDSHVVYGWVWPLVVVGSTVPLAILFVMTEREIKVPEVSYVTFLFWTQVFKILAVVVLFWTALIPNFGMRSSLDEFLTALQRGFYCSFSTDPSCHGCMVPAIIVMVTSPCIDAFNFLLIKYAEGAIYTTIVVSSSRPISSLFWTLFIDTDYDGLLWRPRFDIGALLTFAGLLIIVPATCLYAYFSHNEENADNVKKANK